MCLLEMLLAALRRRARKVFRESGGEGVTACGKKLFFRLFVLDLIDVYLFPEGWGENRSGLSSALNNTAGLLLESASVSISERG